jgi:glycosyltransferase involved in cell wall biosynthesis
MLAADTGVQPIMVGPHPMVPLPWFPGDPEPGRSGTDVHIASLGIADIRKQTDVFVAAAEQVLARHPDWKATVVGLGGTRFVTADSPVSAVGEVDDDEFEAWLDRATVLVQLRDGSNGESSGVVAKALARGVPLVATEIGAVGELPDDVLVKVDRAISASELAEVIERLVLDQGMRSKRSEAGRRYAGEHTYRHQASAVLAAVLEAAAGVNVAR